MEPTRISDEERNALHPAMRTLVDKEEIREVVHTYARGINRGDRDLIRSIYNETSWEVHGPYEGTGQGWADLPRDPTERLAQHHAICQSMIELDGDTAYVETYFVVHMQTTVPLTPAPDVAVEPDPGDHVTLMVGRFLDRFDRERGRWAISVRKVVWDWARAERGTTANALMQTGLVGCNHPNDLVYHMRDFAPPPDGDE